MSPDSDEPGFSTMMNPTFAFPKELLMIRVVYLFFNEFS